MKINMEDRVFVSPAGFWTVWKMKHGYGVYNANGVKCAYVEGTSPRCLEMASVIATAFDAKWQW